MDNKYITIALVAAICVSLGGTFITLNKLSEVGSMTHITGYDVSDTGQGRILIAKQVSIVVNVSVGPTGGANYHDDVYFGSCAPDTINLASYNLTSNSSNTADGSQGNCTGAAFPDYIHVYNTGNVDANVTIQSTLDYTQFITSTGDLGLFGYKTMDGDLGPNNASESLRGGCHKCVNAICAGIQEANVSNWVNFGVADQEYYACENLTWSSSGTKPSFRTYLFAQVPPNAEGQAGVTSADLTYTAYEIV